MTENTELPKIHSIAIMGGTGKEGKGLAYRWVNAGYKVIIGSRVLEKALAAVEGLKPKLKHSENLSGMTNFQAAGTADLVVMTVPFAAHRETLVSLIPAVQDKVFIDVTVPLVPPKVTRAQMPPAGSAAMEAQLILGERVKVVSAFQNISYEKLLDDEPIECDVLVCGNSKEARAQVMELIKDAGLLGWDAGPLDNSIVAEAMTSVLIGINKRYGVQSAGIKITGIER
jgi:NADPH-dependent F420 reductase